MEFVRYFDVFSVSATFNKLNVAQYLNLCATISGPLAYNIERKIN
jgi:hypothetical protein